jgi:hypothetical protein
VADEGVVEGFHGGGVGIRNWKLEIRNWSCGMLQGKPERSVDRRSLF